MDCAEFAESYLSAHQRSVAPFLYKALKEAARVIRTA